MTIRHHPIRQQQRQGGVFFAVRSHHYRYFCALAQGLPGCSVVSRKSWWLPLGLPQTHPGVNRAVNSLGKEWEQKWPWMTALMPVVHAYLWIRGVWLLACYRRLLVTKKAAFVGVWNGQRYRQQLMVAAAQEQDLPCLFFENGLLPNHTTIDSKGVNYGNSMPRKAHDYIPHVRVRSKRQLRAQVQPLTTILVPFQVETDSQILRYSPWIDSMQSLVAVLLKSTEALPGGWQFVCKPHPKEPKVHRWLYQIAAQHPNITVADTNASMSCLFEQTDAVMTINSTVGIEAIQAHKKVVVLGQAFYAISGLVLKAHSVNRLGHIIKLLPSWEPDAELREAFLHRLAQYQVHGDWRRADKAHYTSMQQRIQNLLTEFCD